MSNRSHDAGSSTGGSGGVGLARSGCVGPGFDDYIHLMHRGRLVGNLDPHSVDLERSF